MGDEWIRASDTDREHVVERLRDHAIAGRLTTEELDERSARALAARTLGELGALLADLPRNDRRRPEPAKVAALLLAEGVVRVLIGVILVSIAIVLALAWAGARLARLAVAAATRTLDSGRAPAARRSGLPAGPSQ